MTYDARIQALLESSDERWNNPLKNREITTPYGIAPLDQVFYGLDVVNGEFIVWQGEEKQRKTTAVENVIINGQMFANLNPGKYRPGVVVDMLESSMGPEKYTDTLRINLASRYLIRQGHMPNPTLPCKLCGGTGACKELILSYKYVLYNPLSHAQKEAATWAKQQMMLWDLHVFGPSPEEGNTRNLQASMERWKKLIEERGKKEFVCDHAQQYDLPGQDYEKLNQVVPAHANMVAMYKIVNHFITQVSLTSAREASQGMGKYTATGGRKAAQESNTIFSMNYTSGSGRVAITVEDSRDAGQFSVWQPLQESSGAFFELPEYSWGRVARVNKLEMRPGMTGSDGKGNNGANKGR